MRMVYNRTFIQFRFCKWLLLVSLVNISLVSADSGSATEAYTILRIRRQAGGCSVNVRIQQEITQTQLKAVAERIRVSLCPTNSHVLIAYLLPEMKIGAGAWATTDFDPDLSVAIVGLTPDEKTSLLRQNPAQAD